MTTLALSEAVPLAHALVNRVARDHDVRLLFIKGPVAGAQGLRAERGSVDVDALVDPARRSVLAEALPTMGWVDEHPYTSPTVLPMHSLTFRHVQWPCELDLHDRFPGFFADPQAVFEALWGRRVSVQVAGQALPCPDVAGQSLILALHSLRDPHIGTKAHELSDLATRLAPRLDKRQRRDLAELARDLGAGDTAAPFLSLLGAPQFGEGTTGADDLRAWRLRTQPPIVTAVSWVNELKGMPLRRWPAYLWYAATLSDVELRLAQPGLPDSRWALMGARARRLRRGISALPDAIRSVAAVEAAPSVEIRTTWGSRRVPALVLGVAAMALGTFDRVVTPKRGVVIRTFPDFDDQGLEMAAALAGAGLRPLTWLVKRQAPTAEIAERLPPGLHVVNANSARGVWAYLRARVVVHTHGVYGIPQGSRRKLFVNVWHGMPVKRLAAEPTVSTRQTDLLTVTSSEHGRHIADTWNLDPQRVVETGLPRNDRLMRATEEPPPAALARVIGGRPLLLWLPTYRRSIVGEIRRDGVAFDNPYEFPGSGTVTVGDMVERLGAHLIVKTHPMAPLPVVAESANVSIWDENRLRQLGLTLYELLGHADVLVTDYSSVWVDFIMVDRPMVFAIGDAAEYAASRGHYFDPLEDHMPGPVATDLNELEVALRAALDNDPWQIRRRDLRAEHHAYLDAKSADRVAALIQDRLSRT